MLSNYFSFQYFALATHLEFKELFAELFISSHNLGSNFVIFLCLFNIFCYFVTPFVFYYISSTSIDRKK